MKAIVYNFQDEKMREYSVVDMPFIPRIGESISFVYNSKGCYAEIIGITYCYDEMGNFINLDIKIDDF